MSSILTILLIIICIITIPFEIIGLIAFIKYLNFEVWWW